MIIRGIKIKSKSVYEAITHGFPAGVIFEPLDYVHLFDTNVQSTIILCTNIANVEDGTSDVRYSAVTNLKETGIMTQTTLNGCTCHHTDMYTCDGPEAVSSISTVNL